jgi:ABC-type nitrate/sulfonate/bicarbonate transport system substrate-binding protein
VKRSWADKNRSVLVRFLRSMAQTMRWLHQNRDAAVDYLATEMKLKREHARRGWEFYTGSRIWHPDGDINVEGLQVVTQIYAEQSQLKLPALNPAKYIDQSYLQAALQDAPIR